MCLAALQQQKRQVELEVQSAKVDDAEVQQLADKMHQLEAANADLQSSLAQEVKCTALVLSTIVLTYMQLNTADVYISRSAWVPRLLCCMAVVNSLACVNCKMATLINC